MIDNNELIHPPSNIIEYLKSNDPDIKPCFAKLRIKKIIEWTISNIKKSYRGDISDQMEKLLFFSINMSWQKVNKLERDPYLSPIKYPSYTLDFLPILLAQIERKTYGDLSGDKKFIEFLLHYSLKNYSLAS